GRATAQVHRNLSVQNLCRAVQNPSGCAVAAPRPPLSTTLSPSFHIVFLRYQIYYGYPLKTYLEYPIIIAQDVILIYCIMHFSGNAKRALVYNVCTFISAASKLVQLQHLWQTKDSGQVSTLTWGMSVYTSSGKLETTWCEALSSPNASFHRSLLNHSR
uniref:Solute carrier family 66 member 3 n=1 Tax=Cyanistes caeruleus TaxID=156563 RepID=A0A8C0UI53_CYACU